MEPQLIGERLSLAYRDLVSAEAQLGETLAPRGIHVGVPIADQWTVLHDYLHLYARGLSPAGMLVLGGRPDEGSRQTGIPFTGSVEARDLLGLDARGHVNSPSSGGFWRAVALARESANDAPLESLFGTVHLAHAVPFDLSMEPEVRDAASKHVLRVLDATRPQAAICVGADALAILGRALRQPDLVTLSGTDESGWLSRWPPGTRLSSFPYAEVPVSRPFRTRVVPVPEISGAHAVEAEQALAHAFSYVL